MFHVGMDMSGRVLAKRYHVGEMIGQGRMATVYRAHDQQLGRAVAIKVLRAAYARDPQAAARVRQEARQAARLDHPNIVAIHDIGVDVESARAFIVMDLVDGPDLGTVLAEGGRLPVAEAIRVGHEAAKALQAAHEAGVVHGDLKPGNILLDRDGTVRVADFGISARDAADPGPGAFAGSAPYASPEEVLGDPTTRASDIYSLGVVLYEALTGRRPFSGSTPAAIALDRLRTRPEPPSAISPDLPTDVDGLILRAMSLEPADRYPSAAEFGFALSRFGAVELGGVRRAGGAHPRAAASAMTPRTIAVAERPGVVHPSAVSEDAPTERHRVPAAVAAAGWAAEEWPVYGESLEAEDPYEPVDDEDDERRPAGLLVFASAIGALGVVLLIAFGMVMGDGQAGGVLSVEGTPAVSPRGGVALGPTASPTPTAAASPTPTPTPMPTSAATLTPTATPSPTARPTPPPTPPPTARPTPRPTARPTPPPAPAQPAATAQGPVATVRRFYDLVEAHRYDEAAQLWTARMREEYPPDGYIDGRFDATTRIDVNSARTVSRTDRTAVVAVDLTEYRQSGPTRHWVGRWDMVRTSAGWRMDEPHF